jgi:hypothetical protein
MSTALSLHKYKPEAQASGSFVSPKNVDRLGRSDSEPLACVSGLYFGAMHV